MFLESPLHEHGKYSDFVAIKQCAKKLPTAKIKNITVAITLSAENINAQKANNIAITKNGFSGLSNWRLQSGQDFILFLPA
jgi:hypothetical protein